MNTFFEVNVKYQKIDETGKEKKVSQTYLIDAVNNGDAEKKAHEQLQPYISGEFDVKGTKQANFSEIIPSDNGDIWFKCQVAFIAIDEEKGIEKKTKVWMLVQANNCKEAYENIELALSDTVSDFEIPKVSESPIVEVFTYFESSEIQTGKVIVINAPDGQYSLPLMKVAKNRAAHYSKDINSIEYQEDIDLIMNDDFEGIDWLLNNTNFEDWKGDVAKLNDEVKVLADDFWTSSEDFEIVEL